MNKNSEESILKSIFVTRTNGYLDISGRRALWELVANEFNGEFKITKVPAYEIEIHRMTIQYKSWQILLSESDTKPLKFEINFQTGLDFTLIIGIEDALEKFLKLFGNKEVQIGFPEFDQQFLIKSNHGELAKKILSNLIAESILLSNLYSFSYTTNLNKMTSNLTAISHRNVKRAEEMRALVHVFFRIIDRLEEYLVIY